MYLDGYQLGRSIGKLQRDYDDESAGPNDHGPARACHDDGQSALDANLVDDQRRVGEPRVYLDWLGLHLERRYEPAGSGERNSGGRLGRLSIHVHLDGDEFRRRSGRRK